MASRGAVVEIGDVVSGEAGRANGGVNGAMRSSSVRSMKKEGVEESTLPGSQRRCPLTVVRLVLRLQQLALLPAVRLSAHPRHLLGCRILLLLMALPSAWCSYSGVANQSLFTLSLFTQRVCCLLLQSSFFD